MYWKERLAPSLARLEKAAQKGLARDDVACSRVESPLKLEELGELTKQLVLVCNSPQLDIPVTPQNRKERLMIHMIRQALESGTGETLTRVVMTLSIVYLEYLE
jgi:hypothetical protein